MNLQPIVEGHGEISAVPVLLRRLCEQAQAYQLGVNSPIRKKRAEFVDEARLRKAVRLACSQQGCAAVLVLFDSDDACPKELASTLQAWATEEAGKVPCQVVMAHREYEAWFLAAIESLRGIRGIRPDATSHPDPEAPRGAKRHLEERMYPRQSYAETADQAALSARLDLATAYQRCRSFRRLVAAFGKLAQDLGITIPNWPPPTWGGPS